MEKAGTPEVLAGEKELQQGDVILEFMMNTLRLSEGFDISLLKQHAGLSTDTVRLQLDKATEQGFLETAADHIKPTRRGMQYLNNLLENF